MHIEAMHVIEGKMVIDPVRGQQKYSKINYSVLYVPAREETC